MDGFRFTAKGCDHRQPGHGRDGFEIVVWDGTGAVAYQRAGTRWGWERLRRSYAKLVR